MSDNDDQIDTFETYGESYKSASHMDETDENLPAANIEFRKKREQRMEQVFGEKRPSKELPLEVNLYNVTVKMLHTLTEIKDMMKEEVPKGIIYNYSFTLAPNAPFVHIDFAETEDSDIPITIRPLNFPQQNLFDLKIVNDGPAEISFMTNLPRSVKEAITNLKAGESDRVGIFTKPIIKSLKVVNTSTTQSAAIRVRTLI